MADSSDLRVQILSLLKITNDLIYTCYESYDGRSGTNDALAEESVDFRRASGQLVELRNTLDNLFEAATTNGAHSLGIGISVDVVIGLLSRCKDEIDKMETMLKEKSGRKRIEGPSSSFNQEAILTDIASSANELRAVVGRNFQASTGTSAINSTVYMNSVVDFRNSKTFNILGSQYVYNHSPSDEDQQRIHKWLSAPDPSSNHNDAVNKRGPETGLWLINGELLRNWRVAPNSFALLYGILGCGKSVLCSTVIEEVKNRCKENPGFALAYFYFDFTDLAKQKTSSLIRSFLTQLSSQLFVFPDVLVKLHAACHGGSQQASTSDLVKALKSVIGNFHHVYFIIDALDECTDQKELLKVLREIADWKLHNLHVLATSRRERYIEEGLNQIISSEMNVDSDRVDEDIRCYLRTTLENDHRFQIWTREEQQEIQRTMMERANGMFRWVACQLDVLVECSNLSELRNALRSLPTTLEETYDRILLCVRRESHSDVVKLLQWLAFSVHPLTLLEMAEVFAIDRDKHRFDPNRRPRTARAILGVCSSLIKVSYTDDYDTVPVCEFGTLSLAHLSVKEYLISEHFRNPSLSYFQLDEKLANSAISCDCLLYLLQFDTIDCLCNQTEASISFGRYAAEFWITHAQSDNGVIQNDVQELVTRLLSSSGVHFNNWITLFDVDEGDGSYFLETSYNVPRPLYYALLLGLGQIANELVLSSSADVNMAGGSYGSALASASIGGHKEVVQMLLENGADVNIAGGKYGSALASASSGGHKEVVQMLIENGSDVNIAGGSYGSALASASIGGHKEVAKILLENGADVNIAGGHYGSALASASIGGYKEVVQMLLENGADVNIAGGEYGSALVSASTEGHKEVVQILLESGADVNIAGESYGRALVLASTEGHQEVVRMLLESGADVNEAGESYGGALVSASTEGHKEVVQMLLENGADVNIAGGFYGSALVSASTEGHQEVVQMLLKNRANVNIAKEFYGSALVSASTGAHKEVMQMLIENGANVNIAGESYSHALVLASTAGHQEVVQMLLENGADVNKAGVFYGSALASASSGGHKEVVQMLLENGADVNIAGEFYGSALVSASTEGHQEVVRMLLESGADVNGAGESYGSALMSASTGGYKEVVQMLIENGADVNIAGGFYGSALVSASTEGHKEVVQILLENGADVNIVGGQHGSALGSASTRGHQEVVQILLKSGADVNSLGGGNHSPLRLSSTYGHVSIAQILLDHGADVNLKHEDGYSALKCARKMFHKAIVQLLLEHGAEIVVDDVTPMNITQ